MRRITPFSLALLTVMLVPVMVGATPAVNGVVIGERVFNDCPFTTVTSVNNYPSLVSIEDGPLICSGFANLHVWTLSADGGATAAAFNNDSDFRIAADLVISGTGQAESGLRISPWWSPNVDGRFNIKSNFGGGEIACFGGRLPFFSFTGTYGLHYVTGEPIHLEITYKPHGLNASSPAVIEYELTYQGQTYSSGGIPFDQANPAEDPPHGLWGMLNDGRVGGYIQCLQQGGSAKAEFTNINYAVNPVEPDGDQAAVSLRVFNDCPFTTITVNNNYPSSLTISDGPLVCSGFANLHTWSVSDDGRTPERIDNDQDFRIASDFSISGPGEGGLRVSPWWSKDADGLFNVRSTDGEIAVFGGRLPFWSFTARNNNLRYTAGDNIHLEMIYMHNGLSQSDPGRIMYNVDYNGNHYSSGPLPFDQANPSEDPPHGLWGILNDARAGGHMKAFLFTGQPTAFTNGSWTNNEFQVPLHLALKVTPSSFNPNSNGNYVSAVIEPGTGVDASSLLLNGSIAISAAVAPVLGDANGNGIPDLKVAFDRAAATASIGAVGIAVVTGEVNGAFFVSSDKVKAVKVKNPASGQTVAHGTTLDVTWDTPQGVSASTADVYNSLDGGQSWTRIAQGVANTGHYNWSVVSGLSTHARLAVVLDTGEYGVSDEYTLTSPVGIGDPEAVTFALKGISPNPAKGPFGVNFSLPDNKHATLSVFDVSGRRVASREVGTLGAGRHNVTVGNRLKAGVYMIRLDREGASLTTRAAVIQ